MAERLYEQASEYAGLSGQERVFVLHRPEPDSPPEETVYLSQRDVRELQFAKGAIATGWTLLLEQLGL